MGKLSNKKRKGKTQNAQEKKKPKKLGIVCSIWEKIQHGLGVFFVSQGSTCHGNPLSNN